MDKIKTRWSEQKVVIILLFVAFTIRILYFWRIPGGMNIDEAYAGYLSYSTLKWGIDTGGVHNPVYFEAWGDGMNALNSYLMMPFIKFFGLNSFSVRLPQEIIACSTVVIFYLLAKKVYNKNVALVALFVLAINPWHIMLARWGLESALAPGFLLFGLYFFVLGIDNSKIFIMSAICYGLSLYCYATIWPIVPIIIVLETLYLFYCRKIKIDRYFMIAGTTLFLIALPLMLFLLVNMGFLDEIVTPIFTINKMPGFRGGEISFGDTWEKIKIFVKAVIAGDDGLNHNSMPYYGLYYYFSIPFILIGLVRIVREALQSIKSRKYNGSVFLLIQLLLCMFLGMVLIKVNITRINSIFLVMIMLLALGLYEVITNIKKWISITLIACYMIHFICFATYYFTTYSKEISDTFGVGLNEAVTFANVVSGEKKVKIGVFDATYSQILYYSRLPITNYLETVNRDMGEKHWWVRSFANYSFDMNLNELEECVYITRKNKKEMFLDKGYEVKEFEAYIVAY